jgi:hypothetical protein
LITSNQIWWVYRYKYVLKIENALKLYALYSSNKIDYEKWISINLLNKENLQFVDEVMQQLKEISNITENNGQENVAKKTLQIVNLMPPNKKSFWLTDLIKKINTLKEEYL